MKFGLYCATINLFNSFLVRYEHEVMAGGALSVMRTAPSSFLHASQQKVEIDEARVGLPAGDGSVHTVVVQRLFLMQEAG